MKHSTTIAPRTIMRIYGMLIALLFGSVALVLQIHGDLMITKSFRFDWIVGDLMLIAWILWGICLVLSTFQRAGWFFGGLCLVLSVLCFVLITRVSSREQVSVWPGLLWNLLCIFLPSLATTVLPQK